MSGYRFLVGLILLSSSATACRAEGALAEVLSQANSFEAHFVNLAGNKAKLQGSITTNLTTPFQLPYGTDDNAPLLQNTQGEARSPTKPISTIGSLSSSATGALQTGTINVTANQSGISNNSRSNRMPADNQPMLENPAIDASIIHTSAYGLTFQNAGENSANVDASQNVSVQGPGASISDMSTSAIGAISTGSISIVVSRD